MLAAGAQLVGVNNRDLKSFKVGFCTTERLAEKLWASADGKSKLLVAESGIFTRADVVRLKACGSGALLVNRSCVEATSRRRLAN